MIKNIFKSIGACLAGIITGVVLSVVTDQILESSGILPKDNLWVPAGMIVLVLAYRTIYNILGSYIVARLAPSSPMKHVVVIGVLGTIVSIVGAVATAHMNLGPAWYAWTLAILTLPSSIVGGWLFVRKSSAVPNE